jgi:aldehyde:ferredoxin oxidoreductase
MKGYAGKYLKVDLTMGSCSNFTIDEARHKKFIGGSSLAASLYLEKFNLTADPLAEESPLMVMNGPMVGSGFPETSRFAVCAKSQQTGIWGEAACGGNFGPELKRAGFDGIIITGRRKSPVVLSDINGEAKISPADKLWGKDIYEVTDICKAEDFLLCGARDWTLKRGINNLLGVSAKDDVLPKKILTPLLEGAGAGSIPDMKLLRDEYYAIRGLTAEGIPREEKLRELDLADLCDKLYKHS